MIPEAETVEAACPCCRQSFAIHRESIAIGAEVLCRECGALLAVERREPLSLVEVEPEEL